MAKRVAEKSASSSFAATTSMPLKSLKGVRKPGVLPASGAPASTGDSLAQPPGQIKLDAKATGMRGRVVGSGGGTGASSEGGVCGQAAAEHGEERQKGGKAKGRSEEDPEVEVGGGFGAGPESALSSAVVEREIEGDGDNAVGLKGEKGPDSGSMVLGQASKVPKTEQGTSSRSDERKTSVDSDMVVALTIVSLQFFVSAKYLQCSSWALNEACRRAPTLVVIVGGDYMPFDRLAVSKKSHGAGVPPATADNIMTGPGVMPESRQAPRILPGGLVWCLPLEEFGQGDIDLTGLRYLRLTQTACLPENLEFPTSLQHLDFGDEFDHSIVGVKWPAALKLLQFGTEFDQPLVEVVWPASLLKLQFGEYFDQPLAGVVWPDSLRQIEFGATFNQSIAVDWPASLCELTLGSIFNQPIAGVTWPAALERLQFGINFDQPLVEVVWPPTLQRLQFGCFFDKPIAGVAWPPALQCLQLSVCFNHPLVDVVWPASLLQLQLGEHFDQPLAGVTWPASLEHLEFSVFFNQPLAGVVWPPFLKRLKFGFFFNNPIHGIEWPSSLQHLAFGSGFHESIEGVVWPRSALVLKLSSTWDEWPLSARSPLLSGKIFHKPET